MNCPRYLAELFLSIRRKTLSNQSINQSIAIGRISFLEVETQIYTCYFFKLIYTKPVLSRCLSKTVFIVLPKSIEVYRPVSSVMKSLQEQQH